MSSTIPTRLFRNGRPVVLEFKSDELLFMRARPEDVLGGKVDGTAVRFPDFSVNRGMFSEPKDVLLPCHDNMCVCQFQVRDIPQGSHLPAGSQREYTFEVVHVPEEENYSHSEVQAYKDGVHPPKLKLPNTTKKWFRDQLRQKMRVVIRPA